MVPGTRPHQKKQKAGTMPAANHQPPCTPVRLTRQSAAMPLPGGRPPPKPRHPLPPKTTSKATPKRNAISSSTQQQVRASTTTTETTETTNPVSFPPKMTRSTQAMSSPVPNTMPRPTRYTRTSGTMSTPGGHTMHSPPRFTRASAAMSSPGANPHHSPPRFTRASAAMSSPSANPHHSTPAATAIVSQQPTPTTSVNKTVPTDNSPGGHSSRQSNAINESAEQFDAATSEGNPNEGEPVGDLVPGPKKNVRKKTMGYGLEKMLNRGNRLAIHVAEGKKRPEVPLQVAKLASETGVALRDNLPIYKSWKLYDNSVGQAESRLDVDVKNEGPSKDACIYIIKRGVRQTRYNLKRKYFDESLTKEQLLAMQPPPKMKKEDWTGLVEYWCDPKNQEKSAKNKANRGNVQLHQRTGARSYIAHRYSLRTKYNNMEPDAVDFFGECMNSPRNGRTPLANEIYEQMVAEKERELEEGEEQKSPSKIVADSLSQISRSSNFLPNIGVPTMSKTGRSTSLAAQARMQAQFEEKLQAEREEAARKQEELQAQLQAQHAALEENQSLLHQTQEEVKGMHTKFEETNALLRAVLKLQKD
ncbi:uncharacterized protein [Zea mays]|nr:uncharacterized protein LOC103635891 isoform X2 [Zea mays]|eukprot:XP_020398945.1 uncharacterized protein LOC103635891 isoform X2 [Zea mays]